MKNKEEIKILVSEKRYNELIEIEKSVKNNIVLVADKDSVSNQAEHGMCELHVKKIKL